MVKKSILKLIQERLPDDIKVVDQTSFEFTNDEFISILSWIKYFNWHYSNYGKKESPAISFPVISTRLILELDLYRFKSDQYLDKGQYSIYLSEIQKREHRDIKNSVPLKKLINTYGL